MVAFRVSSNTVCSCWSYPYWSGFGWSYVICFDAMNVHSGLAMFWTASWMTNEVLNRYLTFHYCV
ncbi:MAG: hypothetical protein Q8922_05280 [Bacteroidota bacterium]|nr:hypothetical protein [Bacteroidota bacterium]MDP4231888.1 hypothetical protein [Bacteroidota bacterium]MDP4241405.1 hypothetical protein [Bacteroidota bacterium]MDP4287328.1 hypothetical protein [Bacteroidota bacterium]